MHDSWGEYLGNAANSFIKLATSPLAPIAKALTPSVDSREHTSHKNPETIFEPANLLTNSEENKVISLDILAMARGAVSNGVVLSHNNVSEEKFGTMNQSTPLNVVAERALQAAKNPQMAII